VHKFSFQINFTSMSSKYGPGNLFDINQNIASTVAV